MSFEFQDLTLGSLCEVVTKGTTPTTVGHKFQIYGVNFVKSESILFDGRIDSSKFAFIDEATHASLKRSQLQEGDILFSMAGVYIGKTAVVPKSILPANTNQAVGIVRLDKKKAIPEYINYYLRNPIYNRFLNNLVSQSAQPNLNLTEIRNLPISLPSIVKQKAVVDVLASLDNRISLLRETNTTLEAIAQTLFKSWFVDFDPVKAKAQGKQPEGMDEATAALFPSEFEESALGLIPKGWRVGTLGDVMKNESSTFNFADVDKVIFINTGDVLDGRFLHNNYSDVDSLKGQAKKSIRENDILFSEIRPKNKRFAYVNFVPKNYVVSTKFMVLRALNNIHPRYIYQILKQSEIIESFNIIAESRSGTFPQITFDSIKSIKIVLPNSQCINQYIDNILAVLHKIDLNYEQSQTLTTLRDTLLPRLISGQLRINQAQDVINEVGA